MRKDSIANTMLVAAGVCVVCSLVVSTAAVTLRPIQQRNAELEERRNILVAAGLAAPGERIDVEALFQQVETRKVDLRTGEFVDAGRSAEADEGTVLSGSEDIAGIRRRDDVKDVYLLERDGELQRLILPVRGMGLWAMMHGLIALGSDLNTIESLLFYEHGETPGLGGEVDNPRWRAQWAGKQAFDSQGNVRIEVIKGQVTPQTPDAEYKVDGLSGATFTARGVNNLVRFWLGEQGYGPLLDNMRKQVHP
ncbi:MAG: Na(+)-translocating NADH-quinone reductase subunit C [Thermoguttaceae bacterium]|jgi:Na+-transporting NADH:ubiquinone oxidoreductase subunit C|nr:Na(+)-translocating NADH-quinone reductase subunit C [Thermoguttaceae bacterium]